MKEEKRFSPLRSLAIYYLRVHLPIQYSTFFHQKMTLQSVSFVVQQQSSKFKSMGERFGCNIVVGYLWWGPGKTLLEKWFKNGFLFGPQSMSVGIGFC